MPHFVTFGLVQQASFHEEIENTQLMVHMNVATQGSLPVRLLPVAQLSSVQPPERSAIGALGSPATEVTLGGARLGVSRQGIELQQPQGLSVPVSGIQVSLENGIPLLWGNQKAQTHSLTHNGSDTHLDGAWFLSEYISGASLSTAQLADLIRMLPVKELAHAFAERPMLGSLASSEYRILVDSVLRAHEIVGSTSNLTSTSIPEAAQGTAVTHGQPPQAVMPHTVHMNRQDQLIHRHMDTGVARRQTPHSPRAIEDQPAKVPYFERSKGKSSTGSKQIFAHLAKSLQSLARTFDRLAHMQ